jgi:mRNA interferase YafQ
VYSISTSKQFEKDFVLCAKRKYNLDLLDEVIELLELKGTLPSRFRPHRLSGSYSKYWECHIKPDWLLLWRQNDESKVIELARTGTHSDLF